MMIVSRLRRLFPPNVIRFPFNGLESIPQKTESQAFVAGDEPAIELEELNLARGFRDIRRIIERRYRREGIIK